MLTQPTSLYGWSSAPRYVFSRDTEWSFWNTRRGNTRNYLRESAITVSSLGRHVHRLAGRHISINGFARALKNIEQGAYTVQPIPITRPIPGQTVEYTGV